MNRIISHPARRYLLVFSSLLFVMKRGPKCRDQHLPHEKTTKRETPTRTHLTVTLSPFSVLPQTSTKNP